mgnify:CR=1 FL=1
MNWLPVIYSQKVQKFFRTASVVEDITNTDYAGEIENFGDTVNIIKEPSISVNSYTRGGHVAIQNLAEAGFKQARLTIQEAPKENRVELLMCARMLCEQGPIVLAFNPLPTKFDGLRPTTGFEDTRFVALARIVTNISTIQVDWQQYGPKLAQVALMFGADDLDNVPGLDTALNGPRRSPVAELEKNVKAAGFVPEERNGYFKVP